MARRWHVTCFNSYQGAAGNCNENSHQSKNTGRQKSKKQKRITKTRSPASIAERYLKLRRLRVRISEAESGLCGRWMAPAETCPIGLSHGPPAASMVDRCGGSTKAVGGCGASLRVPQFDWCFNLEFQRT